MRFPAAREWVRVEGREGVFLVVDVDRQRSLAGVIAPEGNGGVFVVALNSVLPLDRTPEHYAG